MADIAREAAGEKGLPLKPKPVPKVAEAHEKVVEKPKAEVVPDKASEAAKISLEAKAARLAEKNERAKKVLDKLTYLKEQGKISPHQYDKFLETLMRLKPECWERLRLMAFPKLFFGKFIHAHGRHSMTFVKMFFMNNETEDKALLGEVTNEMWHGVITKEQKKLLMDLFKNLSPQEKTVVQFKKGKSAEVSPKEWVSQVFTAWFYRIEPSYLALTSNPKFEPLIKIFETFLEK